MDCRLHQEGVNLHRHLLKKTIALVAFVLCPCFTYGQSTNPLRDSLSMAVEELAYHPDSLDLRLKKAGWNLQLEQWQYAIDEYTYVLEQEPTNVAALFYRAYANTNLHRYHFARLDYENLLVIVPGHYEAQIGLALLNKKDNHHTEAYDIINRCITQYPDSALVYAIRAGFEMEDAHTDLALYDYGRAVELDPANQDYRLSHADALIKARRKDEAREELNELVRRGTPRVTLKDFFDKCK